MSEELWKHESWVSTLGKLAWIFVMLSGIIGILVNLVQISMSVSAYALFPLLFHTQTPFLYFWYIIWSIVIIILSLVVIRPKFSKKCSEKDWDGLYDWYLKIGSIKIPWMLIWGAILSGFSWYNWGGALVLVPAIVLLAAGPKKFEWKATE